MLHIVKQFLSCMTMGLQLGLNSVNEGWNVPADSEPEKKLSAEEAKEIIDSLNTNNDNLLDNSDDVFVNNEVNSQLANVLTNIGYTQEELTELFFNGVLISQLKEKIDEKLTQAEEITNETKKPKEALSKQVDISKKLSELEPYQLANITTNNEVTDKNSPAFQRKWAQEILLALWYDISYYSKSKDLHITGNAAVDGDLGPTYSKAMKELQSDLWIHQTGQLDKQTVTTLEWLINNAIQKNIDRINQQRAQSEKSEISNNNINTDKTSEYKTQEESLKSSSEQFLGFEFDKLTKNEILKEVHQGTLNDILARGNVNVIAQELRTALETDNLSTYTFKNTLGFRNYSDAVDILEGNGYKVKWGFLGTVEALWVIGTIDKVAKTQEKISQITNSREKLKIILDYNADGVLDSDTAFYTQERQMFDAIENETEFENMLINLGYESKDQFNAEFSENYYAARENFKSQLARVLHADYVLAPELMLQDPHAYEKFNNTLQAIADETDKSLEENIKLQEVQKKYPELTTQIQEQVSKEVRSAYLQHISASVGEFKGAAATFNVQELTNNILDTASVGVVNGILGFQIWKTLFENGKTTISAGIINFYPYIAGTYELHSADIWEINNVFQRTSQETGYNVNIWGAISIAPVMWVQIEQVNEDTAEGIEKMAKQMSQLLETVLDTDKGDFASLGLSDENKVAFMKIKALQQAAGNTEIAREQLKSGIINNYQRELFRDADSFNVTGISLWAILKEDNLPILGIHGEYKEQTWKEQKNVIRSFEYSATEKTEAKNYATIEKMDKLYSALGEYRNGFSEKTRANKWALQVLTPTNTLEQRWEGLKILDSQPKALRDIQFSTFVESHENSTDDVKSAIISKVSSWMREGRQIKEAKSINEVIQLDKTRRKGFNENFGFNTDSYAEKYFAELSKMQDKKPASVHGTAFDAVSTLDVDLQSQKVSWVDILHGRIEWIADKNGNMLMVQIDNQSDKEAFAKTISEKNKELSQLILDGKVSLYFFKDPHGFDDQILPVVNESTTVNSQMLSADPSKKVDVFHPVNEVTAWSLFGTEKQEEKSNEAQWETDPDHDNQWETDQNGTGEDGNTSTDWDTGFDPTNPWTETPTWETPVVEAPKNINATKSTSKVGMAHNLTDEVYNTKKK